MPNPRDRSLEVERGTLRLMVRAPEVFVEEWNGVQADDFTHPAYRAIFEAVAGAGVPGPDWPQPVVQAASDSTAVHVIAALATEPLLRPASPTYAAEYVAQLRLLSVSRAIANLKSKLQRTNPIDDQEIAALVEREQRVVPGTTAILHALAAIGEEGTWRGVG